MRLSVVSTLYNSEPYLLEFHRRVRAAAESIVQDVEIILVNDGSPDNSLEVARELTKRDPNLSVIDLSRNFGHHKAMMTGVAHATGDYVFLIDSDLEEAPELLGDFYDALVSEGADVVYGVQRTRRGGLWERWTGRAFYRLFEFLSDITLPENLLTVRLMKASYVRALVMHKEREIFVAGLWEITGFHQIPFLVNKRAKGTSSYTLAHKISVLVNGITSFSNKPLILIFYLGALISALSCTAAGYLVIDRMFFSKLLSGWASLIVSIWTIGGLTIFSIGLVGIYLSKVFMETKQRPYTIIKGIYGAEEIANEAWHAEETRHRAVAAARSWTDVA